MSRLQAIDPGQATGGVRKKLGVVPNLVRTMASSPAVLEGYLRLSGFPKVAALAKEARQ